MNTSNEYLQEVVQDQQRVEGELRRWRSPAPQAALAGNKGEASQIVRFAKRGAVDEEAPTPARAVDYRITGFWLWKTVVVPPNVYVVHTRRGYPEPLTIGLGASFSFNPYRDAFLLIPAAIQTLLINARCIAAERQGVLVQAYVQWVVQDVHTAYRKLDFSDHEDPMRIVNVQLREQAEAAIKDKVATMSIDDVLSDKQPIIDELTHRLRVVAEGNREGDPASGLGLKIVTVQIKEAVVSSTRLWETLQKPFRAEREKLARMAELDAQEQVARQELTDRQARATTELEMARQLDILRANQEAERFDREQAEQARRHQIELESLLRQSEFERARAEVERQRTTATIEVENLVHQAQTARSERDVALFKTRRAVENDLTDQHVKAQLIARLPEIAVALPKPEELRAVNISSDHRGADTSLAGFLASIFQMAEGTLKRPESANGAAKT
jgi:flotillin